MFEFIGKENQSVTNLDICRSKAKTILDKSCSVQFFLNGKVPSYLFKLRNNCSNRPYILVNQNSSVFKELKVGDILDMEYNQSESIGNGILFKTLITSKDPHDRYIGHFIVELSIIDN